ncbi:nitrate- and nitrite sensing domain-containing protein [Streptomyces sp. WI04-05B]|uniref:sensor histidine kinase n=1 Tax=Streptomyces TaxID=1883 RepID=UPI0029A5D08B|nr:MULTISPECIES: nitrate- and nitrite sensing domain-containing protein [unclassified Streptomyces]MDX2546607.1 nitrate- and nitrite sensing domain-containing protein [Streptomyces sp. WI04-05B]MDX2587762.1 nitrate- and nitrite sensing domain-containing protein [Streptomyces sp. WI04-05A]MDX3751640.1 nitrate- and nitrite sensing domain-containing protein [Streptomyces sp. AK08-02]
MPPRKGARRRLGSIRLSLILLALVPSVLLAAMWGVTTIQIVSEGMRLRDQTELSEATGAMGTDATFALQKERTLSAEWLASPEGDRTALDAQRKETDAAVAKLVGQTRAVQEAPDRIGERMYSVIAAAGSLEYYRGQVDHLTDISPQQVLDQYSSIIGNQIHAFQELSQVDDGDLTSQAGPLVSLEQAAELVAQEDSQLTLAWPSGHFDQKEWESYVRLVSARRWIVEDQLIQSLTGTAKARTEAILRGAAWRTVTSIEDQVLASGTPGGGAERKITLPARQKQWSAAIDRLSLEYGSLIHDETHGLLSRSADEADSLLIKAAALSAGGLGGLVLCVVLSWRITRSLSRRLRGLRVATLGLAEERLPDVVARLNRGEKVDVESATPPLDYGHDELGQVAQAFNAAQRTAVHTAVELADTRRGFQKVILGIARQSQNLVNLQLTKLDALERAHQDPEILKGLYELDSTASQLRRYEENLVIISGERPGRSWTEPVALIDILRSAVGEVAQYQRVEVQTEEDVYLAPPAVADVIHLLAELIDNATAYSPAPSPVGVRAAMVARGLAIEVEDRGLGMSEDDYASFNEHLSKAPQFDVVALADDLRLGMFVIARLAVRHGIQVTLRSSPYGGTTAIVLIPHEVVVRELGAPDTDLSVPEDASAEAPGPAVAERPAHERVREPQTAVARVRTADAGSAPRPGVLVGADRGAGPGGERGAERGGAAGKGGLTPLPRRVPQTSLAAELLEDTEPDDTSEDALDEFSAERAASSLSGFQRGTLRARDDDAEEQYDHGEDNAPQEPDAPLPDAGTPVTSTPPADR